VKVFWGKHFTITVKELQEKHYVLWFDWFPLPWKKTNFCIQMLL